ncbi:phytanoyl-CoA dioxygenase family protein [Catenulispora pinisilvae]|uniref:phytanoyl-CoA dioxygenase family protein n=1 Tax=Catenulispora pinisilvae TaxID=2705253 RepID=UPI0018918BA7|nr:phytanoyl-CoA dioxygenase family protein [Catenulispora pinisilvae]
MLTDEQLKHYHEHGYVVVPCPFDDDDRDHLMGLAMNNVDLSNADGVRLSRLDPRYTVADSHARTLALLERPALVEAVTEIFGGPDFRVLMANWANRTPGIKALINWHTDYQEPQRSLGSRVEVSWYLTPTSPENGCLRLIPGSQNRPTRDTVKELINAGRGQATHWRSCQTRHPDEISLPLGAGDLLIRNGFIWHCTFENTTDEIRYMYVWSYAPLADTTMLVDYELFLPTAIVESPTPLQRRLFALDEEYRASLLDRFGQPVTPLRVRLGYEADREWRASKYYVDSEDTRVENL